MSFKELEKRIGYHFTNQAHLQKAMCHASYANEHRLGHFGCNERLEFLGDSILGFIVAQYLYETYPHKPEGELTKIRAAHVCESALCGYAKEIGLGEALLLGKGEEKGGGRERASTLADAFEALLAAMYLDSDLEQVKKFLLPIISRHNLDDETADYKTVLQEYVQQMPGATISYQQFAESGPDHDKVFSAVVYINDEPIGKGQGKSKKEAEQSAAKNALNAMKK